MYVDTLVKVKFDLLDLFFNFPTRFSSLQSESKITHLKVLDWWFKYWRLWTSQTSIQGPGVFDLAVIGAEGSLIKNVGNSLVVLYNSWRLAQLEKVSKQNSVLSLSKCESSQCYRALWVSRVMSYYLWIMSVGLYDNTKHRREVCFSLSTVLSLSVFWGGLCARV